MLFGAIIAINLSNATKERGPAMVILSWLLRLNRWFWRLDVLTASGLASYA